MKEVKTEELQKELGRRAWARFEKYGIWGELPLQDKIVRLGFIVRSRGMGYKVFCEKCGRQLYENGGYPNGPGGVHEVVIKRLLGHWCPAPNPEKTGSAS